MKIFRRLTARFRPASALESIRGQFPLPVLAPRYTGKDEGYCVGGAFVKWINGDIPFPSASRLSDYLRKANPRLREPESVDYAFRIISANDGGRFEHAWKHLEDALRFRP